MHAKRGGGDDMSEISTDAWREAREEMLRLSVGYKNGQRIPRMDEDEFNSIAEAREAGLSWPAIFRVLRGSNLTQYACYETLSRAWTREKELREMEK